MARRDYVSRGKASRQKKKSTGKKKLLIAIVLLIVVGFIVSLLLLKQKAPEVKEQTISVQESQPKSVLPSRPEEVWSYIQDLETREIPIDNSPESLERNAQLTAEQKRILALLEQDQQETEKAKQTKTQEKSVTSSNETVNAPATNSATAIVVEARPEPVKQEEAQARGVAQTQQSKVDSTPTTTVKKGFGLQCGAFKNKQQAENLQARLAMAGFNSRVSSSADWNRVFIGPIGDRAAAIEAQGRAKSIANCVVINM